jgi:hypothetical protein
MTKQAECCRYLTGTPLCSLRISLLTSSFLRCAPVFSRLPLTTYVTRLGLHIVPPMAPIYWWVVRRLSYSLPMRGGVLGGARRYTPTYRVCTPQSDADSYDGWSIPVASTRRPSLRIYVWTPTSGKSQLKSLLKCMGFVKIRTRGNQEQVVLNV